MFGETNFIRYFVKTALGKKKREPHAIFFLFRELSMICVLQVIQILFFLLEMMGN